MTNVTLYYTSVSLFKVQVDNVIDGITKVPLLLLLVSLVRVQCGVAPCVLTRSMLGCVLPIYAVWQYYVCNYHVVWAACCRNFNRNFVSL